MIKVKALNKENIKIRPEYPWYIEQGPAQPVMYLAQSGITWHSQSCTWYSQALLGAARQTGITRNHGNTDMTAAVNKNLTFSLEARPLLQP